MRKPPRTIKAKDETLLLRAIAKAVEVFLVCGTRFVSKHDVPAICEKRFGHSGDHIGRREDA